MHSKYFRFIKEDTAIPRPLLFFPKCSPNEVRTRIPKRIISYEILLLQMGANGFMKKKTE